jgi:tetraacyldisaccharide 4'-kinase
MPLSLLFAIVSLVRRAVFRLRPARRLPVPVIVIGNISVGGTGKTPLVLWLIERLRAAGHRPGVISRGYGSSGRNAAEVGPDSAPDKIGDEPVLLARRGGCPVWVARRRLEAGLGLLAAHPDVDVIVADDGLQHYALPRDIEIAVLDGQRGLGNGLLLPAGPLREGRSRLDSVDAVVVNDGRLPVAAAAPVFSMRLNGGRIYRLDQPLLVQPASYFLNHQVHAVAAIGNPIRFFETLAKLGIAATRHAYPDHHPFRRDDIPAGTVIMTEKDAVKCTSFGRNDIWVLAVDAEVSDGLEQIILDKLDSSHG